MSQKAKNVAYFVLSLYGKKCLHRNLRALADYLDISYSTLHSITAGAVPTKDTLAKILAKLSPTDQEILAHAFISDVFPRQFLHAVWSKSEPKTIDNIRDPQLKELVQLLIDQQDDPRTMQFVKSLSQMLQK